MFEKSQRLYDAIYAWKDYRAETERLLGFIRERNPSARTLLDVACGTGKHLELLREHFDEVEGVDVDEEMLAIAAERLPGVPLHRASFTNLDLGKRFDVVTCLFSSIAYARTEEALGAAVSAMARHLADGGVLIVEPFFEPSDWETGMASARFVDEEDLKVARIDVSGPAADVVTMTFHYLVGTPEGIDHFTEDHEVGLFRREQYENAFRDAGLSVEHHTDGLMGRGLFIGVKAG